MDYSSTKENTKMSVGNLEPEENVMQQEQTEEAPSRGGKVYPVTSSTTQLLGDLSKAIYEVGWDFNDEFEVQTAGTFKKDKFLCIKNRSLETK